MELAHRLTNADRAALSELYRRFGRPCYSLARRVCADDGLAENVVQEVFLTLWRDPRRFDPARGSFATWLLTLSHRRAVDVVRRQSAARHRKDAGSESNAGSEAGDEWLLILEAEEVDAGRAPAARGAADQVRAALHRLPSEQREVLADAYFGGYTQHEIAAFTGVPPGTVASRMLAGVRRLQSLLADQLGPDALIAEARAMER